MGLSFYYFLLQEGTWAIDPIYTSVVIPIVTSFVGAIIFLGFIAWILRPKVKFSDNISKAKFDGNIKNHVKIVNKTFAPLIDVRLSAEIHIDHHEDSNTITNVKPVEFRSEKVFMIDRRKAWGDKDFDNAIRFSFKENLDDVWESPRKSKLVVNFYATHSISNISRVFTKTYKSNECIKIGTFEFGHSCKIIEKRVMPDIELGLYDNEEVKEVSANKEE